MTHKQHPIGSGFTAAATADDVLAGIDLTGKTVIVTGGGGGGGGIGLEVSRALSKAGASVTATSRNPRGAAAALVDGERTRSSGSVWSIPPRSTPSSSDGSRPSGRLHSIAVYRDGEWAERGGVTLTDAARMLDLGPMTLLRQVHRGLIPAEQYCTRDTTVLLPPLIEISRLLL